MEYFLYSIAICILEYIVISFCSIQSHMKGKKSIFIFFFSKISVVNLEICQEQEHLLLLFSSFRCVCISIYTTFSSCFINSYWVTISVLLTCPQGTDWLRREWTVESYTWVGSIGNRNSYGIIVSKNTPGIWYFSVVINIILHMWKF